MLATVLLQCHIPFHKAERICVRATVIAHTRHRQRIVAQLIKGCNYLVVAVLNDCSVVSAICQLVAVVVVNIITDIDCCSFCGDKIPLHQNLTT